MRQEAFSSSEIADAFSFCLAYKHYLKEFVRTFFPLQVLHYIL